MYNVCIYIYKGEGHLLDNFGPIPLTIFVNKICFNPQETIYTDINISREIAYIVQVHVGLF